MTENERTTIPGVTESSKTPLEPRMREVYRRLGFRVLPPSGKGFIMPTGIRPPSQEPTPIP